MTRRALIWALVGSLTVNMLVAGALAAAFLFSEPQRRGHDGPRPGRGGPPEIGALARGLDDEGRAALRRALRGDGVLERGRGRIGRIRAEVIEALRARPFSQAEFAAVLAHQRAVQTELAERGFAAFAQVVAAMDDAERAAYADRVEAMARRGRGRH